MYHVLKNICINTCYNFPTQLFVLPTYKQYVIGYMSVKLDVNSDTKFNQNVLFFSKKISSEFKFH